jgi:hypothetical protein
MRIEILSDAEEDLVADARFYERQGTGLGDYFLNSIYSDIDFYWPDLDLHLGWEQLLQVVDPEAVRRQNRRVTSLTSVMGPRFVGSGKRKPWLSTKFRVLATNNFDGSREESAG